MMNSKFKPQIQTKFLKTLFCLLLLSIPAFKTLALEKNSTNKPPPAKAKSQKKPATSITQLTKAKSQKKPTTSKPQPSTGLNFLQKDREYYIKPVFKNSNIIYSENFKPYLERFQQNIKQIDRELAKDHSIQPYFNQNYIVFLSSLKQKSNAYAGVHPFSFIGIHPSGSIYFIDKWAMLNWSHDALIHEMSHIYQLSHSSTLDRLLNLFIGVFSYRNNLLSSYIIEGHAVLSESMYGSGGRLFSGWARAFVLSQLKRGLKMSHLLKQKYPPFSGMDRYLHGGYFFAYLHHKYGLKKIHQLFAESRKYIPFGFYGLNSSMKRTFGKDFKSLFEEYKTHYAPLAEKQKSSISGPVAFSNVFLPMNSNEQEIYFLTATLKSPPELIRYIKKSGKVIRKKIQLPLGKLFYKKGKYYSSSIGKTSTISTEFSLFKEGNWSIEKYNSRQVMDFHKDKDISMDTRESYWQNSLLLNGEFYDTTHSSAVMDHEGNIYYFKQEGARRILYKNKQALASWPSYYGYPVEADSSGVYFIGATPYGSSLFVYKKGKGVFRLTESDTITYGRKISEDRFLVSEIGPDWHEYKVEKIKEIPESPTLYSYSFKKKSIFETPLKSNPLKEAEKVNPETLASAVLKTSSLKEAEKVEDTLVESGKSSLTEDELEEMEEIEEEITEKTDSEIAKQKITEKTDRTIAQQGTEDGKENELLNLNSKALEKAEDTTDIKKPDPTQSPLYGSKKHSLLLNKSMLHSSYNPLSQLHLYQINMDFVSLFFQQAHLAFNFTDPLQFNSLSFKTILGPKKRQFHLSYTYKKYRPSVAISLLYDEGYLRNENKIKTLNHISLLENFRLPGKCRKHLKRPLKDLISSPCNIPYRKRYASFFLKYPLYRRDFLLVSISKSLQWGEMQFFNREFLFKQFPYLFYKTKPWRPYINAVGGLNYNYQRKYSQAYSFHKKREIEFLYDLFLTPQNQLGWGKNPLSYIATEVNGQFIEELGREYFFNLNMSVRWKVWENFPRYVPLDLKNKSLFSTNFSHSGQDLYQLDLKMLKVLNHSWYPLKTPFALRRYAPLIGVSSLLSKEDKHFNLFVIPFAGLEGEFVFEDKMIMKAGLAGGYVLSEELHLLKENWLYPRQIFLSGWIKISM